MRDHVQQQPRVVLDLMMTDHELMGDKDKNKIENDREEPKEEERQQRLVAWSKDSVGRFGSCSHIRPVLLIIISPMNPLVNAPYHILSTHSHRYVAIVSGGNG